MRPSGADIAETAEMLYQYERPYRFDSTKIASAFGLGPTPYAEGIRQTVAWMRQRADSIASAVRTRKWRGELKQPHGGRVRGSAPGLRERLIVPLRS